MLGFESLGIYVIVLEVWASISLVGESSGTVGDKNPFK
jgi:hypothetical protein